MEDLNSDASTPPSVPPETSSSAQPADRTIAMAPPSPGANGQTAVNEVQRNRQISAELGRLGISPDEIRRFLAAPSTTEVTSAIPAPTIAKPVAPPAARPASGKPSLDSLQAFAYQLKAGAAVTQAAPVVGKPMPEFRESTVQEVREADALLREAHALRKREKYVDAEAKCRAALDLVPKDAAALEMFGDICQGVARIDEALAAYKRATEAAPDRASAERKYADLLLRQQNWANYDPEAVGPNPLFAVLLSLVFPGMGQFYNGERTKGVVFVLLGLLALYLAAWSPWGLGNMRSHSKITTSELGIAAFGVIVYFAGMVDAKSTAKGSAL